MKTIIGGSVAVLLGLNGVALWYPSLFACLAGTVPPLLLLGGLLAVYLGYEEVKSQRKDS